MIDVRNNGGFVKRLGERHDGAAQLLRSDAAGLTRVPSRSVLGQRASSGLLRMRITASDRSDMEMRPDRSIFRSRGPLRVSHEGRDSQIETAVKELLR